MNSTPWTQVRPPAPEVPRWEYPELHPIRVSSGCHSSIFALFAFPFSIRVICFCQQPEKPGVAPFAAGEWGNNKALNYSSAEDSSADSGPDLCQKNGGRKISASYISDSIFLTWLLRDEKVPTPPARPAATKDI
jgi:hypothetical protein